jgi:putative transposase
MEEIIEVEKKGKQRMVKRFVLDDFKCKYCGGANLVLYGKQKGKQQWWCKDCKRKFSESTSLPRMKSPVTQVGSAVQQYYNGMSLNAICRNIEQQYGYKPNNSTIFRWVEEFTDSAIQETKDIHPKVGDTWIADETVLRIGGQNIWMYDIIDDKTRFLLATRMALSRTTHNAEMLMKEAQKKADKTPKVIITDKNSSYLDSIELTFGGDTEHIQSRPFTADTQNTQKIERWHETLKERTKVMKGLKTIDTAIQFVAGFLVHYNYFRGNEALHGKTPAETAGIKFPYKNWAEIIRQPVSKQAEVQTHLAPRVRRLKSHFGLPETHVGRPRKRKRTKAPSPISSSVISVYNVRK